MSSLVEMINGPNPFGMIVMIVLISAAAGIIATIVKETRRFACHRQDLQFKRELVDRGMSADEVERLVAAGGEQPQNQPTEES